MFSYGSHFTIYKDSRIQALIAFSLIFLSEDSRPLGRDQKFYGVEMAEHGAAMLSHFNTIK
jgi:hypothetical protein